MANVTYKRGSIIIADFDPTLGREQKKRRPGLVVSNDEYSNMTHVMPITRTKRQTPMLIPLDERTSTEGYVMIDQSRSLDLSKRNAEFVEMVPNDILDDILERFLLRFKRDS